ncbi:uncharacterized protein LOC111334958 [Stylophora pistillata]|uniref:uncharacterized protein LOC111334958 n=1 Tax=Stylophora pistillata TaxID=50429 RepID=UPI000C041739|nr:uncharacterized protein LOC111334958 [Stylophora pistillata]
MEDIVSCDVKVCGSSEIQVASVDPQMGKAVDVWERLPKDNLTYKVHKAVKTNLEKGFTFLFLRCGSIYQALSFPPIFQKNKNDENREAININIIMLDSISRPHFHRTMPKATEALRKIKEDSTIKATSLDFELAQSIGQQTFENLRPFFCGVLKGALTKLFFLSCEFIYNCTVLLTVTGLEIKKKLPSRLLATIRGKMVAKCKNAVAR